MTDLKQQVREAVERLRAEVPRDPWTYLGSASFVRIADIADDLEAAAADEPEYEVRWTWGKGIQTFDSEREAWSFVREWRHNQEHTVRRVFVEPIPPKPEPELSVEEAARELFCDEDGDERSFFDGVDYAIRGDKLVALGRALAREQKGAA